MPEPPKRADPRLEADDDPTAMHRREARTTPERPGFRESAAPHPPSRDFVLASMVPPRQLDDLGGPDDFEKTQVGATVVGARAYRPPAEPKPRTAYLTVMAGARAGEMFPLDRDETILGRGPQSTVHLDSDGVSRKHARIVRQGDAFVLEDLGSTNGTFVLAEGVEETRVTFRKLCEGDRVQVGTEVILRFNQLDDLEAQLQQQLYESAVRDPLTRAYNRKHFQERLRSEIAHALRHGAHLSLIILDIDHFKKVNDTWGHPAGDAVLRALASAIMKAIRVEDVFARVGGEEFTLLARGIDLENAIAFAERLRKGIERLAIPWGTGALNITSSMGVAALGELSAELGGPKSIDGDLLVARADKRLYVAKNSGRNRVIGPT
ncbi:MAG: GGDEF domain-containing protein [Myxococcales bacterium]|nr:GGDEF domain-containing protein [Myxococcales bacterium]